MRKLFIILILAIFLMSSCSKENIEVSRYSKIPTTSIKITPDTDASPVKSLSEDYQDPIPVPGKVNSAGAEDSAFITSDGNTLYFFFTPDVKVPIEKQILDGVTGIWVSKKVNNEFQEPTRVFLQDQGKVAGDGCEFVQDNTMLFCSVREGYTGIHWFSAEFKDGIWKNWKLVDFNPEYKVGELHIINDELYFHSDKTGGKGGLDIWMSKKVDGKWSEPVNVEEVNTAGDEGWPFINQDKTELWITKDYGLWRSKKVGEKWTKPELMFSPLAGEASLDNNGNVYFTHHFLNGDKIIEADIYVAYKK
ncbi:MAG: hypothetical protein PHD81_04185 [Candidatus Nanoarchaeia archaeon]|nr:hypothetical protein [Candidatus Nanoarchaeia archaeon]MDD5588281.1 hypothetical protein [Candidatus Nanoarchaeia archaeon]